jgi:hypothetical protein
MIAWQKDMAERQESKMKHFKNGLYTLTTQQQQHKMSIPGDQKVLGRTIGTLLSSKKCSLE